MSDSGYHAEGRHGRELQVWVRKVFGELDTREFCNRLQPRRVTNRIRGKPASNTRSKSLACKLETADEWDQIRPAQPPRFLARVWTRSRPDSPRQRNTMQVAPHSCLGVSSHRVKPRVGWVLTPTDPPEIGTGLNRRESGSLYRSGDLARSPKFRRSEKQAWRRNCPVVTRLRADRKLAILRDRDSSENDH